MNAVSGGASQANVEVEINLDGSRDGRGRAAFVVVSTAHRRLQATRER